MGILLKILRQFAPFSVMVHQLNEIWLNKSDWNRQSFKFKLKNPLLYPKVSVFIPVAPKDYWIVSSCVQSLRRNLRNPISELIICGKQSPELLKICREIDCVFIDETTVAPVCRDDLQVFVNGVDRSGWIFQQLLKLNVFNCVSEANALVWDSDTCLIRKAGFLIDEKSVIEYHASKHYPYVSSSEALLGQLPIQNVGFTCHKALFNQEYLAEMKTKIEENSQKSWHKAYTDAIDLNEASSISEYEIYSLFMIRNHFEKVLFRHWRNLSEVSYSSKFRRKILSLWFMSLSYHDYAQQN